MKHFHVWYVLCHLTKIYKFDAQRWLGSQKNNKDDNILNWSCRHVVFHTMFTTCFMCVWSRGVFAVILTSICSPTNILFWPPFDHPQIDYSDLHLLAHQQTRIRVGRQESMISAVRRTPKCSDSKHSPFWLRKSPISKHEFTLADRNPWFRQYSDLRDILTSEISPIQLCNSLYKLLVVFVWNAESIDLGERSPIPAIRQYSDLRKSRFWPPLPAQNILTPLSRPSTNANSRCNGVIHQIGKSYRWIRPCARPCTNRVLRSRSGILR